MTTQKMVIDGTNRRIITTFFFFGKDCQRSSVRNPGQATPADGVSPDQAM
ncbi:MAG: hypothetical protein LBU53_04435 [Zoogloeaceae bacterium]|nr:hypothetical protein [Zoogloeaceae bacterium]